MKIEIFEISRETQQETLRETVALDLSCLLFPKTKLDFTWTFDKLKTFQIHYLVISLQCEQPMLSEFLRKKLNPLQLNMVAFKDVPYKTEPKFKPIYGVCKFIDGQTFLT